MCRRCQGIFAVLDAAGVLSAPDAVVEHDACGTVIAFPAGAELVWCPVCAPGGDGAFFTPSACRGIPAAAGDPPRQVRTGAARSPGAEP